MQTLKQTAIEEILTAANVTLNDLLIASHKRNYMRLECKIDADGEISQVVYGEQLERYSYCPDWHLLASVGTGSCPCNCDDCSAGGNPDEYSYEGDQYEAMRDEIRCNLEDIKK